MDDKTIVIDLDHVGDSYVFTNDSIIHKKEFDKVIEHIKKQISKDVSKISTVPVYNTILVNGTRGSGKTSFLYSIKKTIEDNKQKNVDGLSDDLFILDLLDPTMLEEKAHVFVLIISLIKNKVEESLRNKCNEDDNLLERNSYRKIVEELSKGLPSIDGLNKQSPDFWDDANHIINKGMEDVYSSFKCRSNFEKFLDESLKILKKKAFLLMIDDVDTNFKKAIPVLETLRKYLCTDKIITILSGDFSLYSTSVRKVQWENFGKALLKNEYDTTASNHSDVLHERAIELEDQYLKKILQPQNRIKLSTLREKELQKLTIQVQQNGSSNSKLYDENYNEIFAKFGIVNKYQLSVYKNFIKSEPLRTQVDFMNIVTQDNNYTVVELISIFESVLENNEINTQLIEENSHYLFIEILRYLIKEGSIDESYQLQPISRSYELNACLFILSLMVTEKIKQDSFLVFDQMIRLGYIKNLCSYFDNEKDENKKYGDSITELVNYSRMLNETELSICTSYVVSYLRSKRIKNSNARIPGIIRLGILAHMQKKDPEKIGPGMLDYELKASPVPKYLKCLALFPYTGNYTSAKSTNLNEYSVFKLLATVFDIVNEMKDGAMIEDCLLKYAQIKSVSRLDDYISDDEEENYDENDYLELNDENMDCDDFAERVQSWINYYRNNQISIPAYLCSKIFTRFYIATEKISKNSTKSLGELMNLIIHQLFNATLVEEFLDKYSEMSSEKVSQKTSTKMNRNNISTKTDIFYDNLKKLNNSEKELPLTQMIMTCPFFIPFIKADGELKKYYENIDKQSIIIDCNNQLYDTLCKVSVFKNGKYVESEKSSSSKKDK